MKWLTKIESPTDSRNGVHIRHIKSGNDGDVCIAAVTERLLAGKESPLCVDIGVDEGWWSFFVLDTNKTSQVMAFEPNPVSYAALLPYITGESRLQLHNVAISDTDGTLPFFVDGGTSHSRGAAVPDLCVPCVPIAPYIAGKDVDLVKIDTEGHELKILKTLPLERIRSLIFEFTPYWYDSVEETVACLERIATFYPALYSLSRRGPPQLILLTNIRHFVMKSLEHKYQSDILCSRDSVIQ
jgi:FkbM family methyltransferase